jgi:hypothetical protein
MVLRVRQPVIRGPGPYVIPFDAYAGTYTIGGAATNNTLVRVADAGVYQIDGFATTFTRSFFPSPSDVREGVAYGPNGAYVGTLKVGGKALYIFDD